jgi:uncharacterized protein YggE
MNEAKLWFWILIDAALAALVILGVTVGMPAVVHYANSLTPSHTVTVTAQGKTTATPDLAELTFSVVTQGADPAALSNNNNTQMNSVIQFLEGQGIATSDIQTVAYDLQPNYQYPKTGTRGVISGYTLTQSVQVKIHDLTKVASVIGGLAPLGVNQIGGVTFTFSNDTKVIAAARADALAKANAEAQQMAQAAGMPLGGVVSITENHYIPGPQPFYASATALGASSAVVAPNIQPGSQDITDTVTVVYALQ